MAFTWSSYSREFHQRFKNSADPRVESSYNHLLYILSHAKSDQAAANWLGVSRSTVGRWKRQGFGPEQIQAHHKDISKVARQVDRRIQRELKKAGPGAVVETRPINFRRPGPSSGAPGALHVFTHGASLEQIWKIMVKAQAQWHTRKIPIYTAFYFTIKFGSRYQGQFWNGDQITKRPTSRDDSGAYIQGGQTYNTKLARYCADLHPADDPHYRGNNLTLYECLTDAFYKPDSTIERVVFLETRLD